MTFIMLGECFVSNVLADTFFVVFVKRNWCVQCYRREIDVQVI